MHSIGSVALALALALAVFTAVTGFIGGRYQARRYAELSRLGVYAMFGFICVASSVLLYGFLTHDFALTYVYGRSDLRMPILYTMSAFWGGQEGSLLLWVAVTSGLGALAAHVNRSRLPEIMPYFHGVLAVTLIGFLAILNFVSHPFETFLVVEPPIDGSGLNPLLQNPLMVIHPPCLLSGFAAFAIPYAFGMAAFLAKQTGNEWLVATRKWTLIAWILLSVGNILGGMWAYRELGWGGYWAWDPVENAALIPWFTATAFLHSVIIQEQRGMLKRWNGVLVAATYLLTLLGTWLTRSGLIESVHTFAESEIGIYFQWQLIAMTIFSVIIVGSRWRSLADESRLESTVSREGAFMLNNWMFCGLAFVVLWGTLFPKFKEMFTGQEASVGPTWFNEMTAPLGLGLLALIALGTLLPWRRTTLRGLRRNFTRPVLLTLVTTPPLILAYWKLRAVPLGVEFFNTPVALAIVCITLIVFNLYTIGIEFVDGMRARARVSDGDLTEAFFSLFSKHRRRYGGYIVHIGMVFIFLAFLGNAVKVDMDATVRVGETIQMGDYEMTFVGLEDRIRADRRETIARVELRRDGRQVGDLLPARFDYNDYATLGNRRPDPLKVTSEIYIRSTPVEDVYIALLNHDAARDMAVFKLVVLPFTWWFWFGGLVLVAGTLICMWPDARERQRHQLRARIFRKLELGAILLTLALPALVFVTPMEAFAQSPVASVNDRAPLTPDQRATAYRAYALIMTTCEGCAGKTLHTASPSCVASNADKLRIDEAVRRGDDLDTILDMFVAERGERAMAVPRGGGFNHLSWAVPAFAITGAVGFVGFLMRRWTRPALVPVGDALMGGDGSDPSAARAIEIGAEDQTYLDELRDELETSA